MIEKVLKNSIKALFMGVIIIGIVLAVHYPLYKGLFHYGTAGKTELENIRYYGGDNSRYIAYSLGLFKQGFKQKFNQPFCQHYSEFQRQFQQHYADRQFPRYYDVLSQFYAYPPEKIGYLYTIGAISALFPRSLYDSSFPRLALVNIVLFLMLSLVVYGIFRLDFSVLLSLVFVVLCAFDVCLIYVSYFYHSHTLCGFVYLFAALYVYLRIVRSPGTFRRSLMAGYGAVGALLTAGFISSPNLLFSVPILAAMIMLQICLWEWRLPGKCMAIVSFVFGLAVPIAAIMALEYALDFKKYGIFTMFDIFRLVSISKYKDLLLSLPNSPPSFAWYNVRFHTNPVIGYVLFIFVAVFIFMRLRYKQVHTAPRRYISFIRSLMSDPLALIAALFVIDIIFQPIFNFPPCNRSGAMYNYSLIMTECFIIGRSWRVFASRRSTRVLFIIFLSVFVMLFADNFFSRFSIKSVFPHKPLVTAKRVLSVSNKKDLLAMIYDENFIRSYIDKKYDYIFFSPRFLYEELSMDMRSIGSVNPLAYGRRYALIESLLGRSGRMTGIPVPADSFEYGLGYFNQEYFVYYVVMGSGKPMLTGLRLNDLKPNVAYLFDVRQNVDKE